VQSHNDDASFGGVLGGVINVVTKSGTSGYHGAAWEFLRNTAFDAANPFLGKVTPFQQNQFGGSFGGPLPIPHQGQQKTFFYMSYEGFRNHQQATATYNTPTNTELVNGDLSYLLQLAQPKQLYNPWDPADKAFQCDASGNALPDTNKVQTGTGTPCDKMPTDMFDQNMLTYAKDVFPAPNLTKDIPVVNGSMGVDSVDNTKAVTRQDEANFRLDHRFTENNNVWARLTKFRQPVSGSGGFIGLVHQQLTYGYNVGANYTHTFSSSSLAVFHFGRTEVEIDQGSHSIAAASLGTTLFSQNFAGNYKGGVTMIPAVIIQGGYLGNPDPSAHSGAQVDDTKASNIWEWGGDYTKNIGHHTLRFGGTFASNNANALYLNSNVQFAAENTANPTLGGGDALASFLLGIPNVAARRNVVETEHGGWIDGFYGMDQWKMTRKLGLNFGLRYDVTLMPLYGDAAHGNYFVGDMDFHNGTYILEKEPPSCAQTHAAPCIPGGTLPANVVMTPLSGGAMFHNDFGNVQPRVGVTYQLFANTVVRGGYGRFYDNWQAVTQSGQNYNGTWPSLDQLGPVSHMNPVAAGPPTVTAEDPLQQGTITPITPASPFTQVTWFVDPYLKRPYSDQWNFGIQQQVTSGAVLTANYVGSVGRQLQIGGAYNTAAQAGGNATCPGANCGAPYPYIAATPYDRNQGKSDYQALQLSLKGHTQHALTYLLSYTWSKSLDLGCSGVFGVEGCSMQNPYDIQADKGPAATDIPQDLSIAWVYAIPFGKGQKWSLGNSVADAIIGNWNLNGIFAFNSGVAFDVGTGKDIANTGNFNYGNGYGYERAHVVGPFYPSNKSRFEWFNPASFVLPQVNHFGDLGRDVLRSPRFKDFDVSIFKQFPIKEQVRLEFRFEAFNATNTPPWGVPVTSLDSGQFGQITSLLSGKTPRQLQFALKLYF